MKRLFLEDLKDMSEKEVKAHIAEEYAGDKSGFDYGCPNDADKDKVAEYLKDYKILIAYESVGSWGCDSSSYFLMRHKNTGKYQEFSGSHCSCYGFEGQFEPEDVTTEYLKSGKFYIPIGGYDESSGENEKLIMEFLKGLK